jgi:hypothetical protein
MGMFSIVAIASVTCSGYSLVMGIAGIAKGTVEGLKRSLDGGASLDQLKADAAANGFELTAQSAN